MIRVTLWIPSDAVASANILTVLTVNRVTKEGAENKEIVHATFSGSLVAGKVYDFVLPCIAVYSTKRGSK